MSDKIYVYPTDTVYGIGANIYSQNAAEEIAAIKQTKNDKPLSILFNSIDFACDFIEIPDGILSVKNLFSLEITVLLPLKKIKKSVPTWITHQSEFLSFRIVTNNSIDKIIKSEQAPIITTSFNISGNPPIHREDEVVELRNQLKSRNIIYHNDNQLILSGHSSTMVKFSGGKFEIIRDGERVSEIRNLLRI